MYFIFITCIDRNIYICIHTHVCICALSSLQVFPALLQCAAVLAECESKPFPRLTGRSVAQLQPPCPQVLSSCGPCLLGIASAICAVLSLPGISFLSSSRILLSTHSQQILFIFQSSSTTKFTVTLCPAQALPLVDLHSLYALCTPPFIA